MNRNRKEMLYHQPPDQKASRRSQPIDKNRSEDCAKEEGHLPCPLYRKCGGCQLQNMSYPRQLQWKQRKVEKLLGKFGRVQPIICLLYTSDAADEL